MSVYVSQRNVRLHGGNWVRQVEAGERVDPRSYRDGWVVFCAPESWRRTRGPNGWFRCMSGFTIRSTPRLVCHRGDFVHGRDIRFEVGGEARFEKLPRNQWPAGELEPT